MSQTKNCTLSNKELAERLRDWASRLAETGGKAWSLQIPVNFNRDPDMLMCEAADRLQSTPDPQDSEGRNGAGC
jgi:hypothetical protein